ncbi:MAG TPA: DUF3352 domain-containing protein [Solirubrobacteraceae bacterium]|jgi:hypothetical protein|nr:DUF3352 domain-containing protein [Solirubrobacteraceae bacterium]
MFLRTPRARRLAALFFGAAAAAVPLSGCGGSSSPAKGPDPARAVPASAALYAGATLRPSGALASSARAAGQALTHQSDPYRRLLGALQLPGAPALDFNRDVSPWLGTQGGLFVSGAGTSHARAAVASLLSSLEQAILGGSGQISFPFGAPAAPAAGAVGADGAILLDTTNSHAAETFLHEQAAHAGAHATSYRGVSFQAGAGGVALGLVHGFAVIGTESALRAVIDTTAGAAPLASAPSYAALRAAVPAGELGHVYLPGEGVAPASTGASAGTGTGSASQLLSLLAGGTPTDISLIPAAGTIALDVDTLPSAAPSAPAGLLAGGAEASRAVSELPGESFVAVGLGSGASIGRFVHALSATASLGRPGSEAPGLSINGLLGAALAPVSILTEESASARREFHSWLGPGALFASGSGLADLRAGLVIDSRNPALSRAAVAKVAARLRAAGDSVSAASIPGTDAAASVQARGLPIALDIADGRDSRGQTKFVIGLGEASVAEALNPSSAFAAAPSYAAAAAQLGGGAQPSLVVQLPTLLSLLEGIGLAEDPTIRGLVPLGRALTTVSAGTSRLSGGVQRTRVVAGLRG